MHHIISNDPAVVSTREELKQVKESKDFLATNLATQNKMLESQLREMKAANEKKIGALVEAIGLLTGGLFPKQLTIAEEFVVPDDLKEMVLEQRKKFVKDHSLLKSEIRADIEREAREKEEAQKKLKENALPEKVRLRLVEVIKELQS